MGIAEWILVVLISIMLINLAMQAAVCLLLEKIDTRKKTILSTQAHMRGTDTYGAPANDVSRISKRILIEFAQHYLYGLMRYSILQVGKIPSHHIRNLLYRKVFRMKITKRTVIYGGCEIRSPWNIRADNCVISSYCILDGRNGIEIGDNAVLGGGVHIWTEEHNVDSPQFLCLPENCQSVKIGQRAWICSDSTILPGITVGEGTVLASRGCLTKDAEPFGVYGGVPAKMIRHRNTDLEYQLNGKPHWHFF
jgi:acetyltransferase-like isoleucine patch superfamily enzyme